MTMDFAASQTAFADALLHADRPVPDGITTARGEADAARFAVYSNNVFVGLSKALAQHFPVTERLVGSEFFVAMARAYAQDHKPASPLIIEYGGDFPDFIASFQPASKLAYLPDVARIEAAWMRAYHAVDAAPLDLAVLAAVAPERLADLRLVPHPSAGLIRSDCPVGSIWSAHQQETVTPVADWRPQDVLVVRPEMTVNVHILPPQDAVFATCLFNAATLGAAAEAAFAAGPAFDFGTALIGLASLGAFRALQPDEGTVP
ncbi:DNA-binding domain-containing protein [Rhizobium sp. 3T7]|uniref:HvfC/BufC N-terminal domain-containing protein n=1 Tax=Rhizobium sp. 3T7 TaxID=2874922 RepID=UPI001CCC694B|nr:DNA-binding domain-containing protein [Rhizobium sp. 3T7]MBZ9790251.1 DNA-binding domain-containing protein [Rhizobium sp. 3T7]